MDPQEELQAQLGYKFKDNELLQQALKHSTSVSPVPTNAPLSSRGNNDLKILGDCVIKLLTSQYAVCVSPPNDKVSKIVKIKDGLSNRNCQNLIGKTLKLEQNGLLVTNLTSEQISSQLDIFVKSLFGAIFLDAGGSQKKGFVACWKVFLKLWSPILSSYQLKPLLSCFPEPKLSSQQFFKERFNNYKEVDLKLLESRIGFKFLKNPHLLEQAMTHDCIEMLRSGVMNGDPRHPEFVHFQTLEFLGDSVLELVIMEYLYLRSSSAADPLGKMLFFSRDTGQKLYSSRFQIHVARKLELEKFVIKPSHVGLPSYDDFVESLIGAIFVHARQIGLRACAKVVLELWGLETSLEEISQPQELLTNTSTTTEKSEASSDLLEPLGTKPVSRSSVSSIRESSDIEDRIGYRFVDANFLKFLPVKIDLSSAEARLASMNLIEKMKNLQVIGQRSVDLVIAEYVISICHGSTTADLSAEMKHSVNKLMQNLSSTELLSEIAARFQLTKYGDFGDPEFPNLTSSEIIHLCCGAVFMDGGIDAVKILFTKFWHHYTQGATPRLSLVDCFPDTTEQQQKFRIAVNAKITLVLRNKMYKLLGCELSRDNLLEQALTDEKSQGYAKQFVHAYPIGNPFAFQILGKRAVEVLLARQSYLNTFLDEPTNFVGLLQRLEQSLYSSLKARFALLSQCYANHSRYPFPPKKNPQAPYECLMAAVYVDANGGDQGLQRVYTSMILSFPTMPSVKKSKTPKETSANIAVEQGASGSTISALKSNGYADKEDIEDNLAVLVPLAKPELANKDIRQETKSPCLSPTVFASDGSIPTFFLSAPMSKDPLLVELQKKIGYQFVNPFLLKIVVEVNVSLGETRDKEPLFSQDFFEIFRIVGKQAINLLATEFALESVTIHENFLISDVGKKQVETHRDHLCSSLVIGLIANKLDLKKYIFAQGRGSTPYEDYVTALLGAVFIDSRANYLKIAQLFNCLWKSSINPNQTLPLLENCFPDTSIAQVSLRTHTACHVTDAKWKKMYQKLGYVFKNRNLLEQALTDENCHELAKSKFNIYPTGNPFALRLLGRCAMDLVIAYKTLPTSLNTKASTYVETLGRIEKALFNSFKNNFVGCEKYFVWIKVQKNQKFPSKNQQMGPYEAIMGAAFVDSGFGNPGLDTVAQIIINRTIGIQATSVNSNSIVNLTPVPSPLKTIPVSGQNSPLPIAGQRLVPFPIPSTSSASTTSENLNSSFSTKCAANFSISPDQLKRLPSPAISKAKSLQQQEVWSGKQHSRVATVPSPPTVTPKAIKSLKTLSQSTPKKENRSSYASVVVTGKPNSPMSKKLLFSVANAQNQIQALKKKQEMKDHYRKMSLEREKLLLASQEQDKDLSTNGSETRSRCASVSTVASQQPFIGKKRKRVKNSEKKENKKAKPEAMNSVFNKHNFAPPELNSSRVAAWCQNQLSGLPDPGTSSFSSNAAGASSSCTKVYQQRSTIHQLQIRQEERAVVPAITSPSKHSPNHVPVNMVSGYRKSATDDATASKGLHRSPSNKKNGPTEAGNTTLLDEDANVPPSSNDGGIPYMSIIKWTSVLIGVALLLKKYSQGIR